MFRSYFFIKLLAISLLFSGAAYSQPDTSFLSRAAGIAEKQPAVEKVYLHLDKPNYNFGDTIWYKAYTVIGQHHQLSALSGVLYVELISPNDTLVTRQILPLVSGVGWSDMPLPHRLKPGNYLIRAYTNWMRNAGADYFFRQKISTGGIASQPAAGTAGAVNPDVQFFPEGGQLVAGVRSRVAVKAVGANGLGQDVKGTIQDTAGNVVAEFATQHLGMGIFAFTPQSGKTYKAKIIGPGETAFTTDVPGTLEKGFILQLNNSQPDSIAIKVAVNEKTLDEQKNSRFYIIGQSNGKVYYTSKGKLDGLVYAAKTDKARFPSGIVQFTLFSQSGGPIAERIAFIQNKDTLNLKIDSAGQNYTTRQQVKLALNVKDNNNAAVTGSFSVAVINESRVGINTPGESTILNNLLLTTDLKGYIEQPNYYFTNTNDETRANLDLLMLTQGYRRFEWKKILDNPDLPLNYQPERSLELSGVLKTPGGAVVPNGKVTLVATKQNVLRDTVTDANGNFKFPGLYLPDTAKVIIRARKEKNGSNVAIYLKQPDHPPVIKQPQTNLTANLSPELAAVFQKNNAAYQQQLKEDSLKSGVKLKEVNVSGKKISKPDRFNNYGTAPEYDVDMKRLRAEYVILKEGLMFMVPGLTLVRDTFFYDDPKHLRPVKFIVDSRETTLEDLGSYFPKELESVAIIDANGFNNPTIVVTTKSYAGTDTASTVTLKQVTIRAGKITKPDLSNSSNLNGPGNADQVIMGDKLADCITLSDCLNGKIMGVTFDQNGTPHSTRTQSRLNTPPPMVVIIDGIVLGGSHLNDLNADDIASIEVLRSGAYLAVYGSNAPGGALVITTKRGQNSSYLTSENPAGLINYTFNGFYKARAFYTPKYTAPLTAAQTPDVRNTIYWNPNIITNKEGKAAIEYFNNDTKGTYRVVVEGIDDNGNLGRVVYRYKVE